MRRWSRWMPYPRVMRQVLGIFGAAAVAVALALHLAVSAPGRVATHRVGGRRDRRAAGWLALLCQWRCPELDALCRSPRADSCRLRSCRGVFPGLQGRDIQVRAARRRAVDCGVGSSAAGSLVVAKTSAVYRRTPSRSAAARSRMLAGAWRRHPVRLQGPPLRRLSAAQPTRAREARQTGSRCPRPPRCHEALIKGHS